MLKQCKECNNDFETTDWRRKYCSDLCFKSALKRENKIHCKDWSKNHREKNLGYKKKYRKNNSIKIKEYTKTHQKEITQNVSKWYEQLRQKLREALGNKCVRCGETDWQCLQIDHINGGGAKERKQFNNYGKYYKYILEQIKSGSKEYQLLCANCNQKKRYENKELTT